MLSISTQGYGPSPDRRLALAATTLVAGDVQFFPAVARFRRLAFFLVLGPALSSVLLGFFDPRLLFRCHSHSRCRLRCFPRLGLGQPLGCIFLAAILFFQPCLLFLLRLQAFLVEFLGIKPFLFFPVLAIKLLLFPFRAETVF